MLISISVFMYICVGAPKTKFQLKNPFPPPGTVFPKSKDSLKKVGITSKMRQIALIVDTLWRNIINCVKWYVTICGWYIAHGIVVYFDHVNIQFDCVFVLFHCSIQSSYLIQQFDKKTVLRCVSRVFQTLLFAIMHTYGTYRCALVRIVVAVATF